MYNVLKFFEGISFLRILKIFDILYEVRHFRIIIDTIRNLVKPLTYLGGALLIIMYFFALVGMSLFGGLILKGSKKIFEDSSNPNTYHLMNFNDLFSSLVTLFSLMIVNNWNMITQLSVSAYDGAKWVRWYFIAWYFFSVIICLNVILAFAIDMYISVEK